MLFFLPLPCFPFTIPHSVSYHNRQATHQVVAGYTPTGIGRWLRSPESRYPFRTILETVVDLTQFNLVTPPTTVMAQLYETKYLSHYCCSLLRHSPLFFLLSSSIPYSFSSSSLFSLLISNNRLGQVVGTTYPCAVSEVTATSFRVKVRKGGLKRAHTRNWHIYFMCAY